METHQSTAFIFLASLFCISLVQSKDETSAYFTRLDMKKIKVYDKNLLLDVTCSWRLNCISRCMNHENCIYALYNPVSKQCRLYDHYQEKEGTEDYAEWELWADDRTIDPSMLNKQLTKVDSYSGNRVMDKYILNITLHEACERGHLDVVKYILSQELEDINCRGKYRRTPVMEAVRNGQARVFDYLVSQGCDLASVDGQKNNVLHLACIGGNINIIRKLLFSDKHDLDGRGKYGRTPLMWSVKYGPIDVFDLLVSQNCDIAAVDNSTFNILHIACIGGHVDMVRYILSQNIFGIESRSMSGKTPVMVATLYGHRGVFDFLVSKGCNLTTVDANHLNILHAACINGNVDMVRHILSQNIIGIESRDMTGRTPVMMAARFGHRGVFDFLVSKGCNLTTVDAQHSNLLHVACIGGHIDFVKRLLSLKSVKEMAMVENQFGRTPVQLAKSRGHKIVVDMLTDWK